MIMTAEMTMTAVVAFFFAPDFAASVGGADCLSRGGV